MTVDCVSLHTSGAKLQIISICDKKITKNNPESVLCVIFMQKLFIQPCVLHFLSNSQRFGKKE
jgi:hypothetical protein